MQTRTLVNAALRQFYAAISRKQFGQIGPQVLVQVIAVGALKILELMEVFAACHQSLGLQQGIRHVLDRCRRMHRRLEKRRRSHGFARCTRQRITDRLTGHRIGIVVRRHVCFGIDGIDLSRWPIWRHCG